MELSNYHDKCICQICKCGKHKCPKPHVKGDFETSYGNHYPKHEVQPTGTPKKQAKYEPKHYEPSSLKSIYQDQYVGGSQEFPQRVRGPNSSNEIIPKGDFQGDTAYANSYRQFQGNYGQLRAQILRQRGGMPNMPFQGQSTYNSNYIGSSAQRPQKHVAKDNLAIGGQFTGETTYGNNYTEKQPGIRSSPEKPKSNKDLIGIGEFQGDTSYNSHYIPVPMARNQKYVPKGELSVGNHSFNGESQYNQSYKEIRSAVRAPIVQPPNNAILPDGNFQGDSTYQTHFVGSPGGKQPIMRPKESPLAKGQFKGSTTYGDHYVPSAVERYVCPLEKLKPPAYNPLDQQHLKFNSNLNMWV